MKKQIYLAGPFFTPEQLNTIQLIENLIKDVGLVYYSPRQDGVLKNMTPEERKLSARKLFNLNCARIMQTQAMLCLLDDKDQGTNWENGFAFYHRHYYNPRYRLFAFTSERKELNVMLQQSFDYHAKGKAELRVMLAAFKDDVDLPKQPPTADIH